jgi:isopentenyl phosphate kinase
VIVLKLGGSVVTEKERPETLDGPALDRAADAVAACDDSLVVVHGGGSFGHPAAETHGVSVETGTRDAGAATAVHGAMTTLNRFVLDRLHDRGVPALPVHPLSAAARDADGALSLPLAAVETMLDESFVPVLHGDVVATAGEGVTVLSGDEVVARLAAGLGADRVGLCSTVPGVLDADGEVVTRVGSLDDAALGGSAATDVTGGMAGKVRTLLGLDAPAHVFDLDGLDAFLAGEAPGTVVD